jgi:predicted  nucleic acid-binding Zn-ribbon protein
VSNNESKKPSATPSEAMERLTKAVSLVIAEISRLQGKIAQVNNQSDDLKELVCSVTNGDVNPREMVNRLHILEEDNRDLRDRLKRGAEVAERLLARIDFLENQK